MTTSTQDQDFARDKSHSSCRNILSFRIKKKTHQTKWHHETIKILNQWEALEKKVKQPHLPIRGPHWGRHWRTGPVNSNNQSNPKKEQRNPPTVRSTSKFKTEGPRKNTPSLGKTFNSSNLPEEATKQPSNSEYPIISDAKAKAVSISPIVHRLSLLCFCL